VAGAIADSDARLVLWGVAVMTAYGGAWALHWLPGRGQRIDVGFAEVLTVKGILGEPAEPVEYSRVPWCVYCHPEVA